MEDKPEMQKIPKLAEIRFLAMQFCIRLKALAKRHMVIHAEYCLKINTIKQAMDL